MQLLFGIAIRAVLLKRGRASAAGFLAGGAVMTGVPSAVYLAGAVRENPGPLALALAVLLIWTSMGALTGLFYWRLARPGAPAKA
jgi:hypothetical protein